MSLSILILTRVLGVASLVLILGYLFGNFSRNATLTKLTKAAAILLVVGFIAANIAFFRFGGWRYGASNHHNHWTFCQPASDSAVLHH